MIAEIHTTTRPHREITRWRKLFALAAAFAVVLVLASAGQDLAGLYGEGLRTSGRVWLLDVDAERSVPTWFAVVLLYTIAQATYSVHVLKSAVQPSRLDPVWLLIALAFLAASADEAVGVHEKLSELLASEIGGSGLLHFAWALPAGIASLVGLAVLFPFFRSLPAATSAAMILSAALYLGGAVVLEMVGGSIAETDGVWSPGYRLSANLEEALEFAGSLLFLFTVLQYRECLAATGSRSAQPTRRG